MKIKIKIKMVYLLLICCLSLKGEPLAYKILVNNQIDDVKLFYKIVGENFTSEELISDGKLLITELPRGNYKFMAFIDGFGYTEECVFSDSIVFDKADKPYIVNLPNERLTIQVDLNEIRLQEKENVVLLLRKTKAGKTTDYIQATFLKPHTQKNMKGEFYYVALGEYQIEIFIWHSSKGKGKILHNKHYKITSNIVEAGLSIKL
jgi:hypothetical protein